jgi:hypothetical protein
MSLTVIAVAGIVLGFLCMMVGFLMDSGAGRGSGAAKVKQSRHVRRLKTAHGH